MNRVESLLSALKTCRRAVSAAPVVLFLFAVVLATLSVHSTVEASTTSGVTYQGRILKPDGQPLEGSHVQFRLLIRTPGAENCMLFEEMQAVDMSSSSGEFAITINDGNGTRSDSNPWNLARAFANRGSFTFDAAKGEGIGTWIESGIDRALDFSGAIAMVGIAALLAQELIELNDCLGGR